MRRSAFVPVFLAIVLAVASVRAQSPEEKPLAFEVASIKPNTSGDRGGGFGPFGEVEFRATNVTVRNLIGQAFQRRIAGEVVGGPSWLDLDRFDIVAKAGSPTAPKLPMLRTLLSERFKLITHLEKRDLPIYVLVVSKPGVLRASGSECAARPSPCTFRPGPSSLTGRGVPIAVLVSLLSAAVQRTVVDRTNLREAYDIDLHWSVDVPGGTGPNAVENAPSPPSDSPSIFTAVQEQLGLKLESTRGPVEVLVIDHVERPTPD